MKRISFSVPDDEYLQLVRYADKKRYHKIGHLARFCMERYIRQYPEFDGDRGIGIQLSNLGKVSPYATSGGK